MRISSLHDDLLWPCITHVCGLGEVDANGQRVPLMQRSPLVRAAQFGVREALHSPGSEEPLVEAAYDAYQAALRPALRQGYETVVAAVYDRFFVTDPTADPTERERCAFEDIARCRALADDIGLHLACSAADFASPNRVDTTHLVLEIEGMDWVRSEVQVEALWESGVRLFALQYNRPNALCAGDCAAAESDQNGLTPLGRRVVVWLLERGAVLDLAHTAYTARTEILDLVEARGKKAARVAYTHGGIRDDTDVAFATRLPGRFLHKSEALRILRLGGIVGLTPARLFYSSLDAFGASVAALFRDAGNSTAAIAIGTDFGGLGEHLLFPEVRAVGQLGTIGSLLRERHGFSHAQEEAFLRTNATQWLRSALQ